MSNKIIIGCDPDSKASGIAVYQDGILTKLECMQLINIACLFRDLSMFDHLAELHIENVNGKSAVWHSKKESRAAYGMTCQRVGKCKQVQIEIERMAEYFNIKVVHHSVSKMWKNQAGKKQFQSVTGWEKSGNEDSRSSAYFGWLGVNTKQS